MIEQQASRSEVEDLAGRIEKFGQSLTPTQQALLAEMLQSAMTVKDPDDVSGHALSNMPSPTVAVQTNTLNSTYYYVAPVLLYYGYDAPTTTH